MPPAYLSVARRYPTPPVLEDLIPRFETLPITLRNLLHGHPEEPLDIAELELNGNPLSTLPHLQISAPSSLPPLEIPSEPKKSRPREYTGNYAPSSWLVYYSVKDVSIGWERLCTIYPLALHLGSQKILMDYTIHPLLALINEDHLHHGRSIRVDPKEDPQIYNEEVLVTVYLLAMAQRWFSAVTTDTVIRVWAIATKRDNSVQIYWSDIQRALLPRLEITINRSERWTTLEQVHEDRDMLACVVAGIWKEIRAVAPSKRNRRLWPLQEQVEDSSDEEVIARRRSQRRESKKRAQERAKGPPIMGRVVECAPLAITAGEEGAAAEDSESPAAKEGKKLPAVPETAPSAVEVPTTSGKEGRKPAAVSKTPTKKEEKPAAVPANKRKRAPETAPGEPAPKRAAKKKSKTPTEHVRRSGRITALPKPEYDPKPQLYRTAEDEPSKSGTIAPEKILEKTNQTRSKKAAPKKQAPGKRTARGKLTQEVVGAEETELPGKVRGNSSAKAASSRGGKRKAEEPENEPKLGKRQRARASRK